MNSQDYETIQQLKQAICHQFSLSSTDLERADYELIAEYCQFDYRTAKRIFSLSQNARTIPKRIDLLAYYCLYQKALPSNGKMPNLYYFRQYQNTNRTPQKEISAMYIGKYQVCWVNVNKVQERVAYNSGELIIEANSNCTIQINKERYNGKALHKGEHLYCTFENDLENFYYIVRVGKTIAPELLIYLPFMVMAVHNTGHQYANMGLLVKQETEHLPQEAVIERYLATIPNYSFRIGDDLIGALEHEY